MQKFIFSLLPLLLLTACSTLRHSSYPMVERAKEHSINSQRMIIWNASLSLEVDNLNDAVKESINIANNANGYLEKRSNYRQQNATLKLRIPSDKLTNTLTKIEKIGDVKNRYISSRDVTEQYIDLSARLKNKIVLRDRMKKLLDKANDVKDVIAIEKELNRIQSDIDVMQGRLKFLKNHVDMSELTISFSRKKILGPLGYLLEGIVWGVTKLFVIRP